MPAPTSREHRIYLALWRKAYLSQEPIKIQCRNKATAIAMRQGMYRAIRPYRHGEAIDEQLLKSAERFVVYLTKHEDPDQPHWLEIRERAALTELEGMWDQLGLEEEDLLVGEERDIMAKFHALSQEVEADRPSETTPSNPFYDRRG